MKEEYNPEFEFSIEFKLKPQTDRSYLATEDAEIKVLVSRYGATFYQSYPGAQTPELLLLYTLTVEDNTSRIDKKTIIKEFLATGKFEDDVREFELAYTDSCINPVSVNDTNFLNTHGWPLRMIEAPCAWSFTRGNPNVLIGVADTEFRTTHEDLQNKFASISGQSSAGHHHGTMVASVAAANTNNERGIASIGFNSRIAAHRIRHWINPDGSASAYTNNIRDAIWNLFQMGVRIINASWQGTGLTPVAAREMTHSGLGTVLVLSGGNTTTAQQHTDIADIPGVIVVSSVDSSNRHGPTNHARNRWIDICAPGANIMVARGDSNTAYSTERGTSLAAPFVAGTAALMRSVNPTLTAARIEQILKSTADTIADGYQFPGLLGAGRLNAFRAVVASLQILGPDVVPCSGTILS